MTTNVRIQSLIKAISLLMFFITFATNFLLLNSALLEAFIRGIITYIVSFLLIHIIIIIWRFTFKDEEWRIIIESPSLEEENSSENNEALNN